MELYLPDQRFENRVNLKTGCFLTGHVPFNKGKKQAEWLSSDQIELAKKILRHHRNPNMKISGWNKKEIYAYKDGRLICAFESSTDAMKKTGICARNIRSCCNGKRKHAGGFEWRSEIK